MLLALRRSRTRKKTTYYFSLAYFPLGINENIWQPSFTCKSTPGRRSKQSTAKSVVVVDTDAQSFHTVIIFSCFGFASARGRKPALTRKASSFWRKKPESRPTSHQYHFIIFFAEHGKVEYFKFCAIIVHTMCI